MIRDKKNWIITLLSVTILSLAYISISYASSISFTAPTTLAPQSYTLSDIYNKLNNFSLSITAGNHTISTTSSPAGTFNNLTEIYEKLSAEDSDLIPSNIKSGVSIFGVTGTLVGDAQTITWQSPAPFVSMTWSEAETYCSNLVSDGHSDWRLPTIHEFIDITDTTRSYPATARTDMAGSSYYWSGLTYAGSSDYSVVWGSEMGGTIWNAKNGVGMVHCVRSN